MSEDRKETIVVRRKKVFRIGTAERWLLPVCTAIHFNLVPRSTRKYYVKEVMR